MRPGRPWVASLALVACASGPGTLVSPVGDTALNTALYRVGIFAGAPEAVIVLSNGDLECGIPDFPDTERQAEATEGLLAAACREGAQHVALTLYSREPGWRGAYEGQNRAAPDALDEDHVRLAKGSYYGVEEAFLVEIDGLARGYAASEDLYLPDLGDGGTVRITEDEDDVLSGWFVFPGDGLSGEFRAERCTGSTEIVDKVAAAPINYCR